VLIAAGMARMPLFKYIQFNFLGTIPKSFILLLIGFYFGQAYAKFDQFLTFAGFAAAALVALYLIAFFTISKVSKKYLGENG